MKAGIVKEEPNYFLLDEKYYGKQPYFYEPKDYPWVAEIEKNWTVIRDEMMDIISQREKIPNANLYPPSLSSPDAWKNVCFYNYTWKKHKNCNRFPKTDKLLSAIPNMTYAGLCLLEPHTKVHPHNGDTNTTIRCHLGIKIPAPLPLAGISVGNEERSWEDGKILMFSDAQLHTVWNDTDEQRYIFTIDVVRHEYAKETHTICSKVLAVFTMKAIDEKVAYLKKVPPFVANFILNIVTALWYVYIPVQRRFGI